jgi:hypothetical protein
VFLLMVEVGGVGLLSGGSFSMFSSWVVETPSLVFSGVFF